MVYQFVNVWKRMHFYKGCVVLLGVCINVLQIYGLQINFPQDKVGNYGERTEMNCVDAAFDVSNGYDWFKDNSLIYNSATGDVTSTGKYTSSHGADYFTLVITNTALNDNGVYRCNYNFQDESDTLAIQAKGKFSTNLECNKTVKALEISWTDFYPNTATISSVKSKKGMTIPGSASTPVANGDFFNMTWTSANIDISDVEDGLDIEIDSSQDFSYFANITLLTTLLGLAIASLVLCLLGCFGLLGAVAAKFSCLKKVDNKILLGFVVFCLILLVISLGLGAAVLIDDDIECNKKYVGDIAIASLVISSIGIVGGIVIVVLIIVTNKSGKADKGKTPAETQEMTFTRNENEKTSL